MYKFSLEICGHEKRRKLSLRGVQTPGSMLNRRTFLAGLIAAPAAGFLAPTLAFTLDQLQGPSRFASQFFDIAHEAGLTAPMVFGDIEKSTYLVEAIGGGGCFLPFRKHRLGGNFFTCGMRPSCSPPSATHPPF